MRPDLGRGRGAFTLLEVLIALAIIAIGIMGTLGVLLAVHQHNTHSDESSRALRACQEVMEQLWAMSYDQMVAQNGVTFAAVQLHPTAQIGTITVTDVSPADEPSSISEIRIRIQTAPGQVSTQVIDKELVTRRSRL